MSRTDHRADGLQPKIVFWTLSRKRLCRNFIFLWAYSITRNLEYGITNRKVGGQPANSDELIRMVDEPIQRKEGRREVSWIAMIRLPDGSDHPCTIRDVSSSGFKICIAAEDALPENFMVKVVGRQLVFRVRMAWRRQHLVGVLIEKIAKLADPPPSDDSIAWSSRLSDRHERLGSHKRYHSSH